VEGALVALLAAFPLGTEERGVGAGREPIKGVVRFEVGQTDVQARSTVTDWLALLGARLIEVGGPLITRGVGFVLIRCGLVCVRSTLVRLGSGSRVIDRSSIW
jgi:hypothetical protein